MVGHEGAGVFTGDEIKQSSNPRQHAYDTVNNLIANNFRWLAVELESNDDTTYSYVREACERTGNKISHGLWSQNAEVPDVLAAIERRRPQFYIVNSENGTDEARWTPTALDALVATRLPGGYGLIFTEGAMGRDKNKSLKYRSRGFFSIPEAIESENANATILEMLVLSGQLGWNEVDCGPCVYINRNYPANAYSDQIGLTKGRFSVYRLGDIDDTDWTEFGKWPRVTYVPPVTPPPTPTVPARTTTVIMAEIVALAKEIEAGFKPGTGDLSRARVIRRIAESTDVEWYNARETIKTALDASGA
jgi:hypothetical protein